MLALRGINPDPGVEYKPLQKDRSIRLLKLVPDSNKPHGFRVQLSTFVLDEAPPYSAVSYTWGSAQLPSGGRGAAAAITETVPIECDGKAIDVGKNLFDFLCQAWSTFAGTKAYLWVDAICINQSNVHERSHQVLLMGDIYKAAETVLIWLGTMEPEPDALWTTEVFIPAILDLHTRKRSRFFDGKDPMCTDVAIVDQLGEELCEQWRKTWIPFFAFFHRQRWFTRGWVIQEVVLKTLADVKIMCGTKQLSWQNTANFFAFLERSGWGTLLTNMLNTSLGGWDTSEGYLNRLVMPIRYMAGRGPGRQPNEHTRWCQVFEIVGYLRPYDFTDKKDHVYGCLGMAVQTLSPEYTLPFEPDYDLSVEDIFTKFTGLLLQKMPTIELLCRIEVSERRLKTLPSWVPDYSLYNFQRRIRDRSRSLKTEPTFDASLTSTSTSHLVRVDGRVLTLEGARFDTISERGSWIESRRITNLEWFLNTCLHNDVYAPTGQSHDEVLLRTLATDSIPATMTQTQNQRWLKDYCSNSLCYTISQSRLKKQSASLPAVLDLLGKLETSRSSEYIPTPQQIEEALQKGTDYVAKIRKNPLYQLMGRVGDERRLLKTKEGYFGLGPWEAGPGDEVWLLKGSRTPFVLRKKTEDGTSDRPMDVGGTDEMQAQDHYYQLLGEVYVHGMMHGEMMTEELKGRIAPVKIV